MFAFVGLQLFMIIEHCHHITLRNLQVLLQRVMLPLMSYRYFPALSREIKV
jgi:hypothetical protein